MYHNVFNDNKETGVRKFMRETPTCAPLSDQWLGKYKGKCCSQISGREVAYHNRQS